MMSAAAIAMTINVMMMSIVRNDTLRRAYRLYRAGTLRAGCSAAVHSVASVETCGAEGLGTSVGRSCSMGYFFATYLRTSIATARIMIRPRMMYCKYALTPRKNKL